MIKMGVVWPLYSYVVALLHYQIHAFVPYVPFRSKEVNCRGSINKLRMSSDDDGGAKSDRIRRMLEQSWDESKMGIVPKTPENAAKAAAESIISSIESGKKLCLVDLKMPEYEVTSGEDFYDETLAVEFCIQLAKNIGKSDTPILLKNGKAQRVVQRVIDSREEAAKKEEEKAKKEDERIRKELNIADDVFDPASSEANPYAENDMMSPKTDNDNVKDTDDDKYSEKDSDEDDEIDTMLPSMGSMDIDAFRKQLTSNWESSSSTTDDEISLTSEVMPAVNEFKENDLNEIIDSSELESIEPESQSYRLGSLLGDEVVSSGADMFDDVIE